MQPTKHICLLLLTALLTACSGSNGSDSSGSAVSGIDRSGTWTFDSVQCFTNDLSTRTSLATPSGFNQSVAISGNSYTATTTDGTCEQVTTGHIYFDSSNRMTLTDGQVQSATGGSCSIVENISAGSITPGSVTVTRTTNQLISSQSNVIYLFDTATDKLGFLSATYSDGTSNGWCFVVYSK